MKQRQKQRDANYAPLSTKDSSDEEEVELLAKKTVFKEVPTIDIEINENDTLQAISIKYRCTIEELKRLNNIHKENEIYARRTIKVPSKPFSALLAGVHLSGKNSPEEKVPKNSKEIFQKKLSSTLLDLSTKESFNEVIFNSTLQRNESPIGETVIFDRDDEEVHLLPQNDVLNVKNDSSTVASSFSCNGADADISWIALIVCIVIVIFAGPVIYVFYVAEHPEEFHHDNHVKN